MKKSSHTHRLLHPPLPPLPVQQRYKTGSRSALSTTSPKWSEYRPGRLDREVRRRRDRTEAEADQSELAPATISIRASVGLHLINPRELATNWDSHHLQPH